MRTKNPSSLLVCLGVASALAAGGCAARTARDRSEGAARLAVPRAALAAGVSEVLVTVGPGSGPAFAPFSVALSPLGDTWTGFITGIPAGAGRLFEVAANDVAHRTLQSGSATAEVVAGQSVTVVITLVDQAGSSPFANAAPIVDYLTASQTQVRPGGTVRLGLSAHDPDPLDTWSVQWSAVCGSFDLAASASPTWTAPAGVGRCQLAAIVSDNRGASVSVYLAIDVADDAGDAMVIVDGTFNASPVLTSLVADVRYRSPVEGDLAVVGADPDGDPLAYAWSSSCAALTFGTPAAAVTSFLNPDGATACVVTVTVTDGRGGRVVGAATLPPRIDFNLAPVITRTVQPFVDLADPRRAQPVSPGDAVLLTVEAMEPEGQQLTFTWTASAGALDGQADLRSSPGRSVIVWHAPAPVPADARVTVTVSDPQGERNSHEFAFKPAQTTNPCAGQADGTACSDGNPCTRTDTCQAGACSGASPVVCPAPAACKAAGVCQAGGPAAGTCTYADAPTGAACDDGRACTSPDACAAGACVPGPSTCAFGVCDAAGACACTPSCTGRACGPDGCGGSCGSCPSATDTCSAAGQCLAACTPSCTGRACGPDGCGGTCGACPSATDTCSAAGQCVAAPTAVVPRLAKLINLTRTDGISSSGGFSFLAGTAVFSPALDVDGAQVAGPGGADLYLSRYDMATGNPGWRKLYGDDLDQFGAALSAPTADGTLAVVGRVAPAGRVGECGAGAPVTCSGVVASNTNPAESDFLLLVDSATGTVKPGTQVVNNGISGKLVSVAAHPGLNLVAVCGVASATSSLCQGTTASSCTTTTAFQGGLTDLVLAVFDSAGTLQWARQVGGAAGARSDESCSALAIAGDGTVWAAGRYQGELDLGTGALPSLPNLTGTRHMWVAHFGATGATLAAQAYGTLAGRCAGNPSLACTAGTQATDCAGLTPATCTAAPLGNVVANDLAIDSAGNLVLGGSFTGSFPLGGLVSAGGTDAFVVKLSPGLAPLWGVRLGNTGSDATNGLAIGPGDDVVAVGGYSAVVAGTPTTGAAALTAPAGTAAQVFVLKLAAASGATHSAGGYGDAAVQQATKVTASGSRVQLVGAALGVLDFGPPTAPVDAGTLAGKSFTTLADIQ